VPLLKRARPRSGMGRMEWFPLRARRCGENYEWQNKQNVSKAQLQVCSQDWQLKGSVAGPRQPETTEEQLGYSTMIAD